ncbi:MAG: hypothetical protein CVV36_03180 [Candidatus Methanoperedenaceae archaeon HGW-Methanoperedenaceae-1]|jgi:uncharacterized membrane protein (GlpM family)|nr:MAG: hypothetical protein CVV36_03180 [Candidatus Methanoperedenaceae archaeon HGW-Methanoperedenaceae-1]
MDKKSPYFTASAASIVYFIIYFMLKYLLQKVVDFEGALIGSIGFWIVIFIVHQLLERRHSD